MRTYYTDEDGNRHDVIPRMYKGVTPFTKTYALQNGWTEHQEPDVSPQPQDTSERDDAEMAIVRLIVNLAARYDALQDILAMERPTIPAMTALATARGVPEAEFAALITAITPLKWQLEAVEGALWADCWDGLVSRMPQIMRQIASEQQ